MEIYQNSDIVLGRPRDGLENVAPLRRVLVDKGPKGGIIATAVFLAHAPVSYLRDWDKPSFLAAKFILTGRRTVLMPISAIAAKSFSVINL